MVKILKFSAVTVVVVVLLYVVSFFFSNSGLGPSSSSKVISGEPQAIGLDAISYDLTQQSIPEVKASSYEVIDLSNNSVLLSRRADSSLLVASLTKLMTAWIVVNYGNLSDEYLISSDDTKSFSPSLGLVVGDKVLVSDLLNAMLVGSANDAALALSHYIEQKQNKTFPELMNSEAENLKLKDTRFSNPNGFDSDTNYSSSNDLNKLVNELRTKNIFSLTSRATNYSFSGSFKKVYKISATNQLLEKYPDLEAIKTGYTEQAQGSMINLLKTPDKDYLIIVLGSPNREADTLKLREIILAKKFGNQ